MNVWSWIKTEWWFRVSRKLEADYIWQSLAHKLPKRLVYFAFIRVCAKVDPSTPGFMDAYIVACKTWEQL